MGSYHWYDNPSLAPLLPSPQELDAGKLVSARADGGGYDLMVATLQRRDIPITYDMPGLHAGIDLFTPQAGELFLAVWASVEELWDADADPTNSVQLGLTLTGFDEQLDASLDTSNGTLSAPDTFGYLDVSRFNTQTGKLYQVAESVPYRARVALYDAIITNDLGPPTTTHGALTVHTISVPPG